MVKINFWDYNTTDTYPDARGYVDYDDLIPANDAYDMGLCDFDECNFANPVSGYVVALFEDLIYLVSVDNIVVRNWWAS